MSTTLAPNMKRKLPDTVTGCGVLLILLILTTSFEALGASPTLSKPALSGSGPYLRQNQPHVPHASGDNLQQDEVCSSANSPPVVGVRSIPSVWWSNRLPAGAQVQLRTHWNSWVGLAANAQNGGALGVLTMHTAAPPVTSFFTVVRRGGDRLGLRAPNGNMVGISANGVLTAGGRRDNDDASAAAFQVRQGGASQVQLQGPDGTWLSANATSGALSWAPSPREAETFDVREVRQVAAIRGVSLGSWLVVEGWMAPKLFDGVPALIDGAALQIVSAARGCYLTANFGGGSDVRCDRTSAPGNWETFRLRREGPDTADGRIQLRTFNKFFCTLTLGGSSSSSSSDESRSSSSEADDRNRNRDRASSATGDAGEVADSAMAATTLEEPAADGWGTFDLVAHPRNATLVQIKGKNGRYLQVSDDGSLAFACDEPTWDGPCAFELQVTGGITGEWQVSAGLGKERAAEVLARHRAEWVTAADFTAMAAAGINLVRIPVGYWIAQEESLDSLPFVSGALAELDRAFEMARENGIRVLIDLHAAPGSQSGLPETGTRDGVADFDRPGGANMARALNAIEWLARRYARHVALFGIELLNEPANAVVPMTHLLPFYEEGYRRVRRHTACAYVVINTSWLGTEEDILPVLSGESYTNVIHDVHLYFAWSLGTSFDGVMHTLQDAWAPRLQALGKTGHLVMVGEWSNALPSDQTFSEEQHRQLGAAQLALFNTLEGGWVFWSYRVDADMPCWDFRKSRDRGWLPIEEEWEELARREDEKDEEEAEERRRAENEERRKEEEEEEEEGSGEEDSKEARRGRDEGRGEEEEETEERSRKEDERFEEERREEEKKQRGKGKEEREGQHEQKKRKPEEVLGEVEVVEGEEGRKEHGSNGKQEERWREAREGSHRSPPGEMEKRKGGRKMRLRGTSQDGWSL